MKSIPQSFHESLWGYYNVHGRYNLPWRQPEADGTFYPYKVMVSELMLQQTQVGRVIPKYHSFLDKFPDVQALAAAPLGEVLRAWQGLGYNRRAKFLLHAAQQIVSTYKGALPEAESELVKLSGIGKNTAGAIRVYAFNKPAMFIETNIRTVYIHHFFANKQDVSDQEIFALLGETLDINHPREFYWALMDYGSYLKHVHGNLSKQSKMYVKQSKFHGSKRQIRGAVLRTLSNKVQSYNALQNVIQDERLEVVLDELLAEGLIHKNRANYTL